MHIIYINYNTSTYIYIYIYIFNYNKNKKRKHFFISFREIKEYNEIEPIVYHLQ